MISRRRFLSSTALASAGLGIGASVAQAFTLEQADGTVSTAYHAAALACTNGGSYHAQVIADAKATLEGEHLTLEQRHERLASLVCPLCGCPLAGA